MDHKLSRLMSTATAGYGAYSLANPGHLPDALEVSGKEREGYDLLAQAFGVRDVAVGALGMFGRSPRSVRAAMKLRIAFDLGDGTLLALRAEDDEIRKKVLAVTFGWAALNALALAIDSRRNPG